MFSDAVASLDSVAANLAADKFLECFEKLRIIGPQDAYISAGRFKLHSRVVETALRGEKVTIVLPAFPCKCKNAVDKVLGVLPDRGEELALQRLEAFCVEFEKAYPPGAEVVIFSDGRVFNSLFEISQQLVQDYRTALIDLARENGLTHIRFDSLESYLPWSSDPIIDLLQRFNYTNCDVESSMKGDPALTMLYLGFKATVLRDMPYVMARDGIVTKRQKSRFAGGIAKEMIRRNMAFSDLVQEQYPTAVRFSIHAHTNAGPKYGVHLIPAKRTATPPTSDGDDAVSSGSGGVADKVNESRDLPGTPWHHVICEDLDGTLRTLIRADVDTNRYELVHRYGRPWCFQEKEQPIEEN